MEAGSFIRLEKRARLTGEGRDVLDRFATKVSLSPSAEQRKELLERVKRVPGCESYTSAKLSGWFSRRRKQQSDTAQTFTEILYPSLNPNSLQHLEVLVRDFPDPNDEVVSIWAMKLQVAKEDIGIWLALRRATFHSRSASEATLCREDTHSPSTPYFQPRTSSASASPTISRTHLLSEQVKEAAIKSPPINQSTLLTAVHVADFPQQHAGLAELNVLDGQPPISRAQRPDNRAELEPSHLSTLPSVKKNAAGPSVNRLKEELRQSLMSIPHHFRSLDPEHPSRDFVKQFKPYEAMMSACLADTKKGSSRSFRFRHPILR